jgi:putative oxidoreductase
VFQSLLRMMAAFVFVPSGASKLFGWPIAPKEPIAVGSQLWIGGVIELVAGSLLLLGLFTRPAAFLLSGMMAVAYFQFHMPSGFWTMQNMGAAALLECFACLFLSAAGGGRWSLDRALRRAHA